MKIFTHILLVTLCALMLAACAQEKDTDYSQLEQQFIDHWVEANINDTATVKAIRYASGMWVQWQVPPLSPTVKDGNWVKINYRGYNLRNEMFVTRHEDDARKMGYYSPYTNYAPDFMQYRSSGSAYLTSGQLDILPEMSPGAKVLLVMPSTVSAIATTDIMASKGYGDGLPYSNEPIMMEMELVEVIPDLDSYQESLVDDFVAANPTLTFTDARDGAEQYLKYAVVSDNGGETIQYSDSLNIYYEVYLLENDFLLSTNVASVAAPLGRSTDSYRELPYKPSREVYPYAEGESDGRYIYFEEYYLPHRAIRRVFQDETLTYDSEIMVVFKSSYIEYWLGESLSTGSATYYYQTYWYQSSYVTLEHAPAVVLPYTPMYVKIKIGPKPA